MGRWRRKRGREIVVVGGGKKDRGSRIGGRVVGREEGGHHRRYGVNVLLAISPFLLLPRRSPKCLLCL